LLSKRASGIRRPTTGDVDSVLGFEDVVHFYLPKGDTVEFGQLSILTTQLRESENPPFPHAVFVLDTLRLNDRQCMICNFNIAVSRPAYGDVRGGTHSRGMNPADICRHWKGFRNDNPDRKRMRRCHWHNGFHVPLLVDGEITDDPDAVGVGRKCVAELLLTSPFVISSNVTLFVFSKSDLESVAELSDPPSVELDDTCHRWYAEPDRVQPDVRERINRYFADDGAEFPALDFDKRR
jgi:hypothetical protein